MEEISSILTDDPDGISQEETTDTEESLLSNGSDASGMDFSSSGSETSESEERRQPDVSATDSDGLSESEKQELKEQIQEELQTDGQEDSETDAVTEYTVDDIYTLLSESLEKQEQFQSESLENQKFFIEQSQNILSAITVLALIIGFMSGILLARIVWRKM